MLTAMAITSSTVNIRMYKALLSLAVPGVLFFLSLIKNLHICVETILSQITANIKTIKLQKVKNVVSSY